MTQLTRRTERPALLHYSVTMAQVSDAPGPERALGIGTGWAVSSQQLVTTSSRPSVRPGAKQEAVVRSWEGSRRHLVWSRRTTICLHGLAQTAGG